MMVTKNNRSTTRKRLESYTFSRESNKSLFDLCGMCIQLNVDLFGSIYCVNNEQHKNTLAVRLNDSDNCMCERTFKFMIGIL